MGLREVLKRKMQEAILLQTKGLLLQVAEKAYRKGYADCAQGKPADVESVREGVEAGVAEGKSRLEKQGGNQA